MEQTHCRSSENIRLERLVADTLGEIKRLGYSRRSRGRYRAIWEHLIEFSRQKELGDEFSADLAARFLQEYDPRSPQWLLTTCLSLGTAIDRTEKPDEESLTGMPAGIACGR